MKTLPIITAALWLLAMPVCASAADYDPELTWRVITTEHFNIHFHQTEEQLAEEFSGLVEEVYARMTSEILWTPKRRTDLVLVDRTDAANGFATVTPRNTIVIYVTAPQEDSTLALYDDWSEAVFTHEFTHILHLDTNHSIPHIARLVVGRIISPNQVTPLWIVEGLATFEETRQTSAGRGRTPLVDMIKRTAVLEDDFPPLGNLDGWQPDPPAGNLRYLFGQDFMQYIADNTSRDAWTRYIHTGKTLALMLPAKRVFGRTFSSLYRDWRATLEERYTTQAERIRAEGIREGRLVSIGDASCVAPSFSPDGERLVWSCYDLRTGSAIWMADNLGYAQEILVEDLGAKNFTWRADSQAFVYAATHIVNRFNTWSDVYLYTLGEDDVVALTVGARARDPEFSPDGSRLVVVTNQAQNNQLEVLTVDRRRQALTNITDHTQFSTPRFSPNGRVVAMSVWTEGRRDLWLYSPDGKPLRRLTNDRAIDRDPEWSSDGSRLYFASDRTGVPNVYAIDLDSERLWQVSNVLTGAVAPSISPDGRQLAYQQYSHDGWDVRILDMQEIEPIDRGRLERPEDEPSLHEIVGSPDTITASISCSCSYSCSYSCSSSSSSSFSSSSSSSSTSTSTSTRSGSSASPRFSQAPGESIDTFEQAKVKDLFGEERDYPFTIPPRRYNPLETLPPTFWLPYFQLSPYEAKTFRWIPTPRLSSGERLAITANAFTGGSDTLHHLAWSAIGFYRTDADFFGGAARVSVNRWLPVVQAGIVRTAVPYLDIPLLTDEVSDDGTPVLLDSGERYWERRTEGYLSVSYPYTHKAWIFARYGLTRRDELNPLPEGTYLPAIPTRGWIGSLEGGWRYAWQEGTAYAISTEDARIVSLVGGLLHPWLGTFIENDSGKLDPFTQVQATAEIREYVVNPLVPNHVFAMRLAGGATFGPTDFFGNYQLGGNIGDAGVYATPDEFRMLRGYPTGADIGDMYWLTGFEYRAPIWRIERGIGGTIPLYARYLAGSLFADAGNAFTEVDSVDDLVDDTLVGVGAELRLSMIAAWGVGVSARLGYAVGLTPPLGYTPTDPRAFYALVGTSF